MYFYGLLFIDESGDHGLVSIDKNFPVFVLCGILISEDSYKILSHRLNSLKERFWGEKKVILHSRNIRKCEKEFKILFDNDIKSEFYKDINDIVTFSDYEIISSAIDKIKYTKRFGKLLDDVYEVALSFILERTIFSLDDHETNIKLRIIIEKRGKKEDHKLRAHFVKLLARGTYYVSASRFKKYDSQLYFRDKISDVNGLQFADLIAYPVARYVIDSKRANPAFHQLEDKIYRKGKKVYGLKVFP
ncbi:MAG: DUF3800 domain-containing protein [Melioribacteraceae bacterium]|nr:DUF3800 domain-containing protein [Melioribacteraceae bacterium]